MEKLEKVEKLREKTGVSYEDAKAALEACDYDLLDAIIYLEKLDKVKAPKVESYKTTEIVPASTLFEEAQSEYKESTDRQTFGQMVDKFGAWLKKAIKKSSETKFVVSRHGKTVIDIPSLVLIIAAIFAFWLTLPLLLVGLFCDCKYNFVGVGAVKVDINNVCDKASDIAKNIKSDIKNEEK